MCYSRKSKTKRKENQKHVPVLHVGCCAFLAALLHLPLRRAGPSTTAEVNEVKLVLEALGAVTEEQQAEQRPEEENEKQEEEQKHEENEAL